MQEQIKRQSQSMQISNKKVYTTFDIGQQQDQISRYNVPSNSFNHNDLLQSRARLLIYCKLIQTLFTNLKQLMRVLTIFSLLKHNTIQRRLIFNFAGLSASFLRTNLSRNTQILSLTSTEIEQLASINQYTTSVEQLQQNNLQSSLLHLQFAANDVKNKFPWAVNLQACLMNRETIILKLLNKREEFQSKLEELYLISLSAKGPRSLDTIKNLVNYFICLTIYSSKKVNAVLDYLKQQQKQLQQQLLFFDGLNDIRIKKELNKGIQKLKQLPEAIHYQKVFKYNNVGFMKIMCLRQQHKHPAKYLVELKKHSQQILKLFLEALIVAQNNPEDTLDYSPQQLTAIQKLQNQIESYLSKQVSTLPTDKLVDKRILKNANSHIITMNIASLLFQLERTNQCFYFLQLSLEKAVTSGELERVGMALVLLGRCYYLQRQQKWEEVYLDILEHAKTYPKLIIKEALTIYSRLLFQEGRLFQAQNYLNQALTLQIQSGLEGLILPSYDFSF